MTIDRRRFLQVTTLAAIGSIAETGCGRADDRNASIDRPQLVDVLGPERVRELGARYRAATPGENSADSLRAAISGGREPRLPLFTEQSLDDQVRNDFANGRTVIVDGWVLSITEARQAALFSLTPA